MTKPNRVEHDYEPRIPKLTFFRQSTRLEPPEIVIVGQNGKQYVWHPTWQQLRSLVLDGNQMLARAAKLPGDTND